MLFLKAFSALTRKKLLTAFSGRSALEDGTEVYTLGTGDKITLTFTPDEGYCLVSVALDGSETAVGAVNALDASAVFKAVAGITA